MTQTLEKYWPYLSILLLLILLAAPFAWPGAAAMLGVVAVILGVGAVIVFSVHGHVKAYRAGKLDRAGLTRNILVDVPGLLLTLAAAAFAGRAAGQFVGASIGQTWPGMGGLAGLLAGLLAGVVVGFVVRTVWGKLVKASHRV